MKISSPRRREGGLFYFAKIAVPPLLIIALALFTGLFYSFESRKGDKEPGLDSICDANGDVRIKYGTSSRTFNALWDPNFFLSITLGFGNFSYAAARIIDGLWDVVVGRCGQALLAFLAYTVIRRSMNTEMERYAVDMPLFTSLVFDKASLTSAGKLGRHAFRRFGSAWNTHLVEAKPGRRINPMKTGTRRYLSWLLVIVYVLAFPTMTSIVTGYQPRYLPYVAPPGGDDLVPVSSFSISDLIVTNGERVGLQSMVTVDPPGDPSIAHTLMLYYETCVLAAEKADYFDDPDPSYPRTETCPGDVCNCTISLDEMQILGRDSLYMAHVSSSNITLQNQTYSFEDSLSYFRQCASHRSEVQCRQGLAYLTDGNYTLTDLYIQDHGFCMPLKAYKWGFSAQALFTHLMITIAVAILLMALHLDAFCNGRADQQMLDSNSYSDAVAVARELEKLPFECPLEELPASELDAMEEKHHAKVQIDADELPPSRWTTWRMGKQARSSEEENDKFRLESM